MKRNKKDHHRLTVFLVFTLLTLHNLHVDCASVDQFKSSNENKSQSQLKEDANGPRQGRQLSPSSSGVLASHYDANRLKPLPGGTPRDASVASYNNHQNQPTTTYDHHSGNYNDAQQLQYSPSEAANAYYYYHYPDHVKSKLAYSGPHYGTDLADYPNQKTSNFVDTSNEYTFGSYLSSFIRDILPPREADSKTDPITLTGLASLVVSSLSGLSWVAIGALLLIGAPIIIPCVLAPLIFLLLLLYFIPVIRLDIPATGRGLSILKHLDTTAHFYKRMLQKDECLERISCEIARFAQGNVFEDWISKKLEQSSNTWVHRFSRSFKAAKEGHSCQIFSCNPKYHLQKSLRSTKIAD